MGKRFVFDTNTLISAHLKTDTSPAMAYDRALLSGTILYSTETFDEFATRFVRPKFEKYRTLDLRVSMIARFKEINTLHEPTLSIEACSDPDDDKFLALAISADASCIISGDPHLLDLHPFRGIPILNATDFLKAYPPSET